MSFWTILGDIGAGVAAPFTGGASLAAIPAINAIGAGASAASQSMASNRGQELSANLDAQKQMEQELLARAVEARTAQNNALKQSVFSSLLGQWHPAARPAGIAPSPFANGVGTIGQQALSYIGPQALNTLQNGEGLPALQPIDVSKYTSPSIWERLLGIGGAAASAYGLGSKTGTGGK